MLQKLIDYTNANFGKVENIFINDDHTLGLEMSSMPFHTEMIEKIIDNNTFIEGFNYEYDNTCIFDFSPLDEAQLSSEVFQVNL